MKGSGHIDHATLKDVFRDDFHIGVALNLDQISGREPRAMGLVAKHFNSITPENILKWEEVHPEPDRYHFEPVDQFVAFGEKHDMFIVGHTLVWFHQTPDWVFEDESGNPLNRERLLERMKEHIFTVMGRYKGRIHGWDVVNEVILPDGSFRKSKWYESLGEEHVHKAFEYAQEADPTAQLYYNDYNMWKRPQYEGVIRLVQNLQTKGIQIDGVGIQGHWGLDYPELDEIQTFIGALAKLDVKLMITELDVGVIPFSEEYGWFADLASLSPELQQKYNPYPDALPDSVQADQAKRYAELFALFRKHRDRISRVTFWAVHDQQSWRNYMPFKGRTDYPMLFDRQLQPKQAFEAVVRTASGKK
jgi:endo-1,4-beta-xylanase